MSDVVSKKALLETLELMPDSINIDVLLDRMMLLAKVERGIKDIQEEKVTPHEEVKKMVAQWFE